MDGSLFLLINYIERKIKNGITDITLDYISATPIMIGVSIAVYALCSMISKSLAKLSVIGVFLYGALVVIVA